MYILLLWIIQIRNNETKAYRKAPPRLEKAINLESEKIAQTSTWTIVLSVLQTTMHF